MQKRISYINKITPQNITFCDFLKCSKICLRLTQALPNGFPLRPHLFIAKQLSMFISGLFVCQLDGVSGAQFFSHRNTLADEMKLIFKHADSVPFRICENLVQPVVDLTRTKLLTVSQVRDAFHWMVSRSRPQAVPAFRFEPNPCLFMNFDFRLAHITSSRFCGLQTW